MKKQFALLFLAWALAACQPQAPQTTAAAAASSVAPDITRPAAIAKAVQPLPVLFAPADTLTPPQREVLRTNDLSELWQSVGNYGGNRGFEGFFGPNHFRFGMIFTQASRDAADPAVYHVVGKSRYFQSHTTRPFTGTLIVRRVADLSYPGFLAAKARSEEKAAYSLAGRTYTAHARLQLQEEARENSGLFEGEVLLDFYVIPGQQPSFVYVFAFEGTDDRLPTRGAGLLLRGNRRNVSTGQVKPFIVSPDLAAIAPSVFKDFMLDERLGQINPKYTKLGWNEYWRNDEWWADSPKPRLSL
jgi:hypothetical protein